MTEQEAVVILNAIPQIGPARISKLIEHFGSARKVFQVNDTELTRVDGFPRGLIEGIKRFDRDNFLKEEYSLIEKHRISLVIRGESNYPSNLNEIVQAPVVLYTKGEIDKRHDLCIAVVGSRRASVYGITTANKFAGRLAELGITVVSGLARGVDTSAHKGALRLKGDTIAVLGCGLSSAYPPENRELLEEISQNGAVVSEFPMATPPVSYNFPRRNRIISGLSIGVIVVEASLKSGALITSNFALEQGREVFAVPGKVDNFNAQGTNRLIKQGAKLINNIDDVIEELGFQIKACIDQEEVEVNKEEKKGSGLSEQESKIYDNIKKEPVYIDELVKRCNYSSASILNVLLKLEVKKLIRQIPGKNFVRA